MIPSIQDMYNGVKDGVITAKDNFNFVIDTTADIFNFFKTIFTDPGSILKDLFDKFTNVSPDILIMILVALLILRFLGFEKVNKYICLTLVIALFIALI